MSLKVDGTMVYHSLGGGREVTQVEDDTTHDGVPGGGESKGATETAQPEWNETVGDMDVKGHGPNMVDECVDGMVGGALQLSMGYDELLGDIEIKGHRQTMTDNTTEGMAGGDLQMRTGYDVVEVFKYSNFTLKTVLEELSS